MTKPIVAFHWLRVNGRRQKQQNRQIQTEQYQPPTPNKQKSAFLTLKNKLKRGGQ